MKPKDIKNLVAAHDRLVLEGEILRQKLMDQSGDYIRRIEDQKKRVHNLEGDLSKVSTENKKLKEIIIEMLLKAKG